MLLQYDSLNNTLVLIILFMKENSMEIQLKVIGDLMRDKNKTNSKYGCNDFLELCFSTFKYIELFIYLVH